MLSAAPPAVVIGGGPAGLMAAESLLSHCCQVQLYESAPSLARKFLIAGKGGLNLTHSEPYPDFVARYRERAPQVDRWLRAFGPDQLRDWARELGIETVVGSSGRVFPADFKAGPMLRSWVRRLRQQGLQLHTRMRFSGWNEQGEITLEGVDEQRALRPAVVVLAMGGSSWSKLGASGAWVSILRQAGAEVADLRPSNCGFEAAWSEPFRERFAGQAVKQVSASLEGSIPIKGEFMLTEHGVEGSLIYALSAELRDAITTDSRAILRLDLCPDRPLPSIDQRLSAPRKGRSWSEFLRRQIGLGGSRYGLLRELAEPAVFNDPAALARTIKDLPLPLLATRPIDEAISCAGGVRFESLTGDGMLRALPGVWCAGEMIDWEAPTGGYLLTACLASGRAAGIAAARWANRRRAHSGTDQP